MTIKCIIVDDEPLAQKGLKEYIEEAGFLELIGVCDNAMQAYPFINKGEADLILLDIEMPEMGGMEVLRKLKSTYPEIKAIVLTNDRIIML